MFETQRLQIGQYTLTDTKDYFKLKSCEVVWKYSTFVPFDSFAQAESELQKIISRKKYEWEGFLPIREKNTKKFVGEAGIICSNHNASRCEIVYNLLPEYWGKGYATELIAFFLKYAFEVKKFERIEALVLQNNIASCKVLEKNGFLLEGVLRNFNKNGDEYRNVCYYGMISSDYTKKLSRI